MPELATKQRPVTEDLFIFSDITLFRNAKGEFTHLLSTETYDAAVRDHETSPAEPISHTEGRRAYKKRIKRGEKPVTAHWVVFDVGSNMFKVIVDTLNYPDAVGNESFRRLVSATRCNIKLENDKTNVTTLIQLADDEKQVMFYLKDELANPNKNINAHRGVLRGDDIIHYTFFDEELEKNLGLSAKRVDEILDKLDALGVTKEMYLEPANGGYEL